MVQIYNRFLENKKQFMMWNIKSDNDNLIFGNLQERANWELLRGQAYFHMKMELL